MQRVISAAVGCGQGLALRDVVERLRLPAFTTAVHDVLRAAAEALPGLRSLSREALAARLEAAAGGLRFVERCSTRILRLDGADVGLSGDAHQARPLRCPPPSPPTPSSLQACAGGPVGVPWPCGVVTNSFAPQV